MYGMQLKFGGGGAERYGGREDRLVDNGSWLLVEHEEQVTQV